MEVIAATTTTKTPGTITTTAPPPLGTTTSDTQQKRRTVASIHFVPACLVVVVLFGALAAGRPQLTRIQHIAVIENDAYEQTLPNELKNPFYKTPRVREALAKSSWFGPGEQPVFDRTAEKISRAEIYNVLSHAGLISRTKQFF